MSLVAQTDCWSSSPCLTAAAKLCQYHFLSVFDAAVYTDKMWSENSRPHATCLLNWHLLEDLVLLLAEYTAGCL